MLAAQGSSQLSAVLGSAVIQANPFLTGKTAGYVIDWAERKMGQKVTRVAADQTQPTATTQIRQTSPEFEKYKQAITALLDSIQNPLKPG